MLEQIEQFKRELQADAAAIIAADRERHPDQRPIVIKPPITEYIVYYPNRHERRRMKRRRP